MWQKIRAKRESGLTAVRLKRDPPVVQFPVFIQPYTQQPLILYEIEKVPIPIIGQNVQAKSYMHLQVNKPYIALNSKTYISIRQKELRTCRRTGYELYCEELFVVKHKSKYRCANVIQVGPA